MFMNKKELLLIILIILVSLNFLFNFDISNISKADKIIEAD